MLCISYTQCIQLTSPAFIDDRDRQLAVNGCLFLLDDFDIRSRCHHTKTLQQIMNVAASIGGCAL